MIETPSIAVGNAFLEIKEMANYAKESVQYAIEGILNNSREEVEKLLKWRKR